MPKPNVKIRRDLREQKEEKDSGQRTTRYWVLLAGLLVFLGVVVCLWLARSPENRDILLGETGKVAVLTKNLSGSIQNLVSSFHDRKQDQKNVATHAQEQDHEKSLLNEHQVPEPNIDTTAHLYGTPPHLSEIHEPIEIKTPEDVEKVLHEVVIPLEGGAEEHGHLSPKNSVVPPNVGRQDDAVVRTDFIDDLAKWLVAGYVPGNSEGNSGRLSINVQAANLRYGVGMKGLAWIGENLPAGRAAALDHFFTPDMLSALYRLYMPRFMQSIDKVSRTGGSKQAPLNEKQRKEMLQLYAQRFRGLSGALQGVAALKDFDVQMQEIRNNAKNVLDTNNRYAELTQNLDMIMPSKDTKKINEAKAEVEKAATTYRQAVLTRDKGLALLTQAIQKNQSAKVLDDDTLVYIASWVERRVQKNPAKMDAVLQGATLFLELARAFETAANPISQNNPQTTILKQPHDHPDNTQDFTPPEP